MNLFLKLSRPRFWIYELGSFFIGAIIVATSTTDLVKFDTLLFAFYFLFPANLLIYGINDIFDYETDKLNPKKNQYELLLPKEKHKSVYWAILITNIPFVIYSFFVSTPVFLCMLAFIFFASFYSAKPIRAKARPILDSLFSASHYIATGVFGFYLLGGQNFPSLGVIAGILWAMAMHAYSAVPDISADKGANLQTVATYLGSNKTIIFCGLFYVLSGIIFFKLIGIYAILGMAIYVLLMGLSFGKDEEGVFRVYKYFPLVNTLLPMIWCIFYIYQKFS